MEGPFRLAAAYEGLTAAGLAQLADERPAPPAVSGEKIVRLVHDEAYVKLVERLSRRGGGYLDTDTYVNSFTYDAAVAYVASVLDAALAATRGEALSLVLGRPPGHHAGKAGAAMGAPTLGFCIFNATAAAAKTLADTGLKVFILDFDLHHGNGTQEILYDDPRIVHIDLHQDPSTIYPGTGWTWETGEGEAKGTKINVPLPPGSGDDIYSYAAWRAAEIAVEMHGKPDVLLVDAGFDAYRGDGLGAMYATANTYLELARVSLWLSGHIVVVLQGGYSEGLRRGLPAYIAGILGMGSSIAEDKTESPKEAWEAIDKTMRSLCRELGAPC